MSDALTLVQQAYGHFGRGEIPQMLALMTPDVRWQFVADRAAPYTATVIGPAQVGEWFGEVARADDIHEFVPEQFLAGADHVTVIGRERTTLRASGRTFSSAWVHVWQLREGRIASFWGMLDSEAAARAR